MLRVKEILEIPCMKESAILAGHRGLDNPVLCVDVLEVPDADQWVSPGTFLLTTAYAYKEDASRLEQLVRLLSEGGASGLGIKLGRFIQELPDGVLKTAEQQAFPIVLLPLELPYVTVIKKVMSLVFEREQLLKDSLNKQDILRHTLEKIMSKEENLDFLRHLNLSPNELCCFLLVESANTKGVDNLIIWELVEKTKLKWEDFFLIQLDDATGLLFIFREESCFPEVKNIVQSTTISFQGMPRSYSVGMSGLHSLEEGVKKAYKESRFSLMVMKKLMNSKFGFVDFDSLSHLSFWFTHTDRKGLLHVSHSILDPILAYDKNNNSSLFQTLKVFLLMDCNQKKAAEVLHLHRNSLRYRLAQIEEILGPDPFTGFNLQKLFFALITYTLLGDETSV